MLAKVKCIICGKEFLVKPSRLKNGLVKYCSRKCFSIGSSRTPKSELHKRRIGEGNRRAYAEGRKSVAGPNNPRWGKHCTEETKQKISERVKGKTGRPGKLNPMYGKHPTQETIEKGRIKRIGMHYHTEDHKQKLREKFKVWNPTDSPEVRKKISDALKGKMGGSNNPNWSGGPKDYCEKWNEPFRKRIRAWFNYTCIECGAVQDMYNFQCHHVYYDKKACCSIEENGIYKSNLGRKGVPQTFEIVGDPNKFVLLCRHCHSRTNGSKSREKWARHFEETINNYYGGKSYFTEEEMKNFSNPLPLR